MKEGRPGALRIVALGGGTGLSTLLRGLVGLGPRVDVTAIVAVTDNGGSSGRLRRDLALPAVGDVRACLSATARRSEWAEVLEHRFRNPPALRGHPLGNLLLAAAHERSGSLSQSIGTVSRLVGARCRILPVTNASAHLVARSSTGRVVRGEVNLARRAGSLRRVRIVPALVAPAPGVLEALRAAELIVLGPGSLFSSVIAATLAAGVARAILASPAVKVLIQNLTTQRGETDGLSAVEHLEALQAHLGEQSVDFVLLHRWRGTPPAQGVVPDSRALESLGVHAIEARLVSEADGGRLHDARRLARALYQLALEAQSLPRRSLG